MAHEHDDQQTDAEHREAEHPGFTCYEAMICKVLGIQILAYSLIGIPSQMVGEMPEKMVIFLGGLLSETYDGDRLRQYATDMETDHDRDGCGDPECNPVQFGLNMLGIRETADLVDTTGEVYRAVDLFSFSVDTLNDIRRTRAEMS